MPFPLATWNINSVRLREPIVLKLLGEGSLLMKIITFAVFPLGDHLAPTARCNVIDIGEVYSLPVSAVAEHRFRLATVHMKELAVEQLVP